MLIGVHNVLRLFLQIRDQEVLILLHVLYLYWFSWVGGGEFLGVPDGRKSFFGPWQSRSNPMFMDPGPISDIVWIWDFGSFLTNQRAGRICL